MKKKIALSVIVSVTTIFAGGSFLVGLARDEIKKVVTETITEHRVQLRDEVKDAVKEGTSEGISEQLDRLPPWMRDQIKDA